MNGANYPNLKFAIALVPIKGHLSIIHEEDHQPSIGGLVYLVQEQQRQIAELQKLVLTKRYFPFARLSHSSLLALTLIWC